MTVEWRGLSDSDREALIARLNQARRIEPNGRVRYERDPDLGGDPYAEDAEGILTSALSFPDDVPASEARRAVRRALRSPGPRRLDVGALLGAVDAEVEEFREREPKTHVLVGALSSRYFGDLRSVEADFAGCRVAFHPSVPERFLRGHGTAMRKARWFVPGRPGPGGSLGLRYACYTVEAEGRSETEAFGKARASAAALRGTWNLALRKADPSPPFGPLPLNHVLPGPVEALQPPTGSPMPWPVSYNTGFAGPVGLLRSERLRKHWEDARRYEAEARAGLAASRHPLEVAGFLADYASILDARDPEGSFLGLWGLLERLTGVAGAGRRSDRNPGAAERAAYLLPEDARASHRLTLDGLGRHRNAGVHEGALPDDVLSLLRQLRRYVIVVLELHLNSGFDVSGSWEARAYLRQVPERDRTLQRIADLKESGREEEARLTGLGMGHHDRR